VDPGAAPLEISCFVPAYNEERLIAHNASILDGVLDEACRSHEIVVVDDTSTDRTVAEVEALANPRVEVLAANGGPSFRENLGRAMEKGSGDVVMFVDADMAVDPDSIRRVLARITGGADIAVGSRYLRDSNATRELPRRVMSVAYNRFLQVIFRSPIQDHQCGLKAFRRPVLQALLPEMRAGADQRRAWFWDAELLLRALWRGYRVEEVPVTWVCRPDSHFMVSRQLHILPYAFGLLSERIAPAPLTGEEVEGGENQNENGNGRETR
jgi:glycosyltransferase involved in cell wall biosynthesis